MSEKIRLRRRAWIAGVRVCDEEVSDDPRKSVVDAQYWMLDILTRFNGFKYPHLFEIEFLDERNPDERFVRFGTDAGRMVEPAAIDSDEVKRIVDLIERDLETPPWKEPIQ